MGTIIGLGILRTPGEIARVVQDPWLYMALWTGGGAFALLQMGGVRLGGRIFQVAAAVFVLILVSVSVSLLFGNPEPLPTSQVASNIIHTAPTWAHYGIVVAAIEYR